MRLLFWLFALTKQEKKGERPTTVRINCDDDDDDAIHTVYNNTVVPHKFQSIFVSFESIPNSLGILNFQ